MLFMAPLTMIRVDRISCSRRGSMPGRAACGRYATPLAAITSLHLQNMVSSMDMSLRLGGGNCRGGGGQGGFHEGKQRCFSRQGRPLSIAASQDEANTYSYRLTRNRKFLVSIKVCKQGCKQDLLHHEHRVCKASHAL